MAASICLTGGRSVNNLLDKAERANQRGWLRVLNLVVTWHHSPRMLQWADSKSRWTCGLVGALPPAGKVDMMVPRMTLPERVGREQGRQRPLAPDSRCRQHSCLLVI